MGIPIPSIFVFEREDSKWELVDGLQRVSTILEFMGLLMNSEGELLPPSCLEATGYLPSLSNLVWIQSGIVDGVPIADQSILSDDLKITVRRSRVAVEILKRPSDNNTKFELFQRLNAGGTPANAQELRNCVIIMANREYYEFLRKLSINENFIAVAGMTEDQLEKQRALEYVSRFMVHTFVSYDGKLDVEEYIDHGILSLAAIGPTASGRAAFENTFDLLNKSFGQEALRRRVDETARGKVSLVAFEVIAVGIARNIDFIMSQPDPTAFVHRKVSEFWQSSDPDSLYSAGTRGTNRIRRTIPTGDLWFGNA